MKTEKKAAGKRFKKRTAAAIMAALLITVGCVGTASAAAQSWTHTVSCSATGSTSFVFNANVKGSRTDTFNSYITIYNGKSYTKGTTYVQQNESRKGYQNYTLQGNTPSHPTLYFGTINAGSSVHYYDNTYGGFSSSVTTSQQY